MAAAEPDGRTVDERGRNLRAYLFDLDGVLTPTAEVHRRAWRRLFEPYLAERGVAPYTEDDYFEHIDGKPRYDGVRDLLASRGIRLPEGEPTDGDDRETVCGLGNRKDAAFNATLASEGVEPYPASVAFVDAAIDNGCAVAVVSSSANAPAVLAAAGIADRFGLVVDGTVAAREQLPGKPAPDTYLYAARELGVDPGAAAVVEDATSGIRAGAAGRFGLVIGVDRGVGHPALMAEGADVVVDELDELIPALFPESPGDLEGHAP